MNLRRVRALKREPYRGGPILYWMSRDQRMHDHWALIYAQDLALQYHQSLAVVFCLVPDFLQTAQRHYSFMLKGLQELETFLEKKNISFFLLRGNPVKILPQFIQKNKIGHLVTDFDPLKIKRQWKTSVLRKLDIPVDEVDAHNIVPCWIASSKQEYGAYTFRPKIRRLLPEFLEEFPALRIHPVIWRGKIKKINWQKILSEFELDTSVPEISWIKPGEKQARKKMALFIKKKIGDYSILRNDPSKEGQSNLSPYLHFGQLSAQRVALEVRRSKVPMASREAFLDELIVRRELSDNFCFYNPRYDSFDGFPEWAKKTLRQHASDSREYQYHFSELEKSETHDKLWNAAQKEMIDRGKMHGYMRMYWAKKILEWSPSPERAIQIAIRLNDRYELDGRDPNGYAGIAWSIGGVHDRAWFEREIFGKIRYMSYNGCRSKFSIESYMEKVKKFETFLK